MSTKSLKFGLITAAVLMSITTQVFATILTDLFSQMGGSVGTGAAAGNAGQAAGNASAPDNDSQHAPIWNGTKAAELGSPSGNIGSLPATNHQGPVTWDSAGSGGHSSSWNNGTAADPTIGANSFNSPGQVAGYSIIAGGDGHPSSWNNGSASDFGRIGGASGGTNAGSPGLRQTLPTDVKTKNKGTTTDLSVLGCQPTDSFNACQLVSLSFLFGTVAVNDTGQVLSWSFLLGNLTVKRTLLWHVGAMMNAQSFLEASTVSAGWILNMNSNSNLMVVSTYNTSSFAEYAFLPSVTAVPEPGTYMMLLAGLGLVVFMARRRKDSPDGH